MRSIILGIPILIAIAILQSSLLNNLRFLNGGMDVMLIVVTAWSLVQRGSDGPLWAFAGGVLADSFSGGPPGAITFSLVMVTFLVAVTEGRFYKANIIAALLFSVLGTLVFHLLYLIALAVSGHPVDFAETLALATFPSAVLNFLLMFPTYQAAKWLSTLIAPPKVEIG
jgi:rod shape-determining protein MreD